MMKWIKNLFRNKFLKVENKEIVKEEKNYILWVTTEHIGEGYSSRWHGWMRELMFTYEEALKEKEKIQHQFYDVEIVKVK